MGCSKCLEAFSHPVLFPVLSDFFFSPKSHKLSPKVPGVQFNESRGPWVLFGDGGFHGFSSRGARPKGSGKNRLQNSAMNFTIGQTSFFFLPPNFANNQTFERCILSIYSM